MFLIKNHIKAQCKNIMFYYPRETAGKSLRDIENDTQITLDAPFSKESLLDRLRRFLRASNK